MRRILGTTVVQLPTFIPMYPLRLLPSCPLRLLSLLHLFSSSLLFFSPPDKKKTLSMQFISSLIAQFVPLTQKTKQNNLEWAQQQRGWFHRHSAIHSFEQQQQIAHGAEDTTRAPIDVPQQQPTSLFNLERAYTNEHLPKHTKFYSLPRHEEQMGDRHKQNLQLVFSEKCTMMYPPRVP